MNDPFLPLFKRDKVMVRGQGSRLWDDEGREYLDFLTGIGVNLLGHAHPEVVAAIRTQAGELIHASNYYHNRPQMALAERLSGLAGGAKVFLCNSGAEANEAALKFARRIRPGRPGFLAFEGSFHGRTMGALSVTSEPGYRAPFQPLVPGARFSPWNDSAALAKALGPDLAAVVAEPVQGEVGFRLADPSFWRALASGAAKSGALLLLDEVQTGLGRTGRFFGFEHYGLVPDIVTLAKPLGGGLPLGAVLVKAEHADKIKPGDHGSTFGGNPVACAAGLAVLEVIFRDKLMERAEKLGARAEARFRPLTGPGKPIQEIRRLGLMTGFGLGDAMALVHDACLEQGLLVGKSSGGVIRLHPPMTISEAEFDKGLDILAKVLDLVPAGAR